MPELIRPSYSPRKDQLFAQLLAQAHPDRNASLKTPNSGANRWKSPCILKLTRKFAKRMPLVARGAHTLSSVVSGSRTGVPCSASIYGLPAGDSQAGSLTRRYAARNLSRCCESQDMM